MGRRVIIPLPAASGILTNESGCLLFYAARETSGAAAATLRLRDGSTGAGTLILPVGLLSAGSSSSGFQRCAIPFRQGLFYELVAGAIEGSVSVLLQHSCDEYWARLAQEAEHILTQQA